MAQPDANQNTSPPLTYHLADVEKRAAQNRTFQIPALTDRMSIPVGHFVKLVFCDITPEAARQPAAERMWLKVTQPGLGTLVNDPHFITGLRFGDEVRFEPRHVAGIMDPADLEPGED